MAGRNDVTFRIGAVDRASPVMRGVVKSLRLMGAVAGVTGGIMLAGAFGRGIRDAIKVSKEFEGQMARVGAILGDVAVQGSANFAALRQSAIELGATTVFTARQVAEAQLNFARAGFQVQEIISALPATLDLASAGNIGIAQAASIAATAFRSFATEGETAAQAAERLQDQVDIIAITASKSNQTILDFGEALKFAAPAATTANVSFFEMSSALGILANRGLKGSLAGTALRKTFIEMAKGAAEGAGGIGAAASAMKGGAEEGVGLDKAVAQLLFTTNKGQREFVGFAKAVEILQARGYTAAQMFDIFGVRAGSAMAILTQLGGPAIKKFQKGMEDFTGFADKVAARSLDSLEGDVTLLKSAYEALAVVVGGEGTPAMRGFVQSLTAAITAFRESDQAIQTLDSIITGLIRTASVLAQAFILGFGAVMSAVGRLIAVMYGLAYVNSKLETWFAETGVAMVVSLGTVVRAYAAFQRLIGDDAAADNAILAFSKALGNARDRVNDLTKKQAELHGKGNEWKEWARGVDEGTRDIVGSIQAVQARGEEMAESFTGSTVQAAKDYAAMQEELKKKSEELEIDVKALTQAFADYDQLLASRGLLVYGQQLDTVTEKISNVLKVANDQGTRSLALVALKDDLDALTLGLRRTGTESKVLNALRAEAERAAIKLAFDTTDVEVGIERVNALLKSVGVDGLIGTAALNKQFDGLITAFAVLEAKLEQGLIGEVEFRAKSDAIEKVLQGIADRTDIDQTKIPVGLEVDTSSLRDLQLDVKADALIKLPELKNTSQVVDEINAIGEAYRKLQGLADSGEIPQVQVDVALDQFREQLGALGGMLDDSQLGMLNIVPGFDENVFVERLSKIREMELAAEQATHSQKLALARTNMNNLLSAEFDERIKAQQEIGALELEKIDTTYLARLARVEQGSVEEAAITDEYNAVRLQQEQTNADASEDIEKQKAANKKALNEQLLGQLGATLNAVFGKSKAGAIAQAIISTYVAANKALEYGPPQGPILAGLMIAQGLGRVSKIKKTKPGAAFGTVVGGSDNGRDSVSYSLRPGERVMSVTDSRLLERMLKGVAPSTGDVRRLRSAVTLKRTPVLRSGAESGFALGGVIPGGGGLGAFVPSGGTFRDAVTDQSPTRPGGDLNADERASGGMTLNINNPQFLDPSNLRDVLTGENLDEFGAAVREAVKSGTV